MIGAHSMRDTQTTHSKRVCVVVVVRRTTDVVNSYVQKNGVCVLSTHRLSEHSMGYMTNTK